MTTRTTVTRISMITYGKKAKNDKYLDPGNKTEFTIRIYCTKINKSYNNNL